jgi:hypothetical protein
MALRLALIGGAQHIHRDKRRDEPAPGRSKRHGRHLGMARETVARGERVWL